MTAKKIGIALLMGVMLVVGMSIGPVRGFARSAAASVTTGWEVNEFKQDDGRIAFARVPMCAPVEEQACIDFMSKPRPLIIYGHGAGTAEDLAQATRAFANLVGLKPDVIYVYAVSKDGTKRWDTGICCTFKPVDEVGYLVRAVQQISASYRVNLAKVGIFGDSNGGMLSHMAACERPDVFRVGVSFAGTYTGLCNKAGVKIAQWHGSADSVLPVNGGQLTIDGHLLTFPPASDIGTRMASGTQFMLVIESGLNHFPHYWIYWAELVWMSSQLGI